MVFLTRFLVLISFSLQSRAPQLAPNARDGHTAQKRGSAGAQAQVPTPCGRDWGLPSPVCLVGASWLREATVRSHRNLGSRGALLLKEATQTVIFVAQFFTFF